MSRPTVPQARAWRPEALRELADDWDATARQVLGRADAVAADVERSRDFWTGDAASAARQSVRGCVEGAAAVARALVAAAVAARDGADQLATARAGVVTLVDDAGAQGFVVADDGHVTVATAAAPQPLLVLLAGGDGAAAGEFLEVRATELSALIDDALERLRAADADASADITAAFGADPGRPATTVPAGVSAADDLVDSWPVTSQDGIAAAIASLTVEQRDRLVTDFPREVGNTDGVPWDMRIAANRLNIAAAILAERGHDAGAQQRVEFYRGLLAEVEDPAGTGRIQRSILAFDPARASLVELHGDLTDARGVAVLVPGVNTTIEGSAANATTARRFVSGSHGDAAVITYLGGPFPQVRDPAAVLLEAADPRYAREMAPRLVAFSEDLDRVVGDRVPVTVIGHSYGGSIVGTAETLGLTSDRTLFAAAAGAGVGVDDPGDWHNRNPDVLRFSMTAPGDFIEMVQGIPGGPHGADSDEMPGVIPLCTGSYDNGWPVMGWEAHSGMLNRPSDSWRNILAVITGEPQALQPTG